MGYAFTLDDVAWLRALPSLASLGLGDLGLTPASRLADVAAVRAAVGPEHAAAVLETALLRARATAKGLPVGWLHTDAALQQASAAPVAAHRAARLAAAGVAAAHDVTCSIGADLAALAAALPVAIGTDLDRVRVAMARHNVPGAAVAVADALRPVTRGGTVVFADPARRDAAGRRTWRAADLVPRLDELRAAAGARPLVVKCAPGMDFALVDAASEIEVTSLDGDVREACVWPSALAAGPVRRRATVLSAQAPAWTVTDADPSDCPVRAPGEWLVNPDGAVVRAGLVEQYGARHGLGRLDERIAYLTGDAPPPGVRAFRVLEHGAYAEKALRTTLRRHECGTVEILVRGLDVDPNALRPRLKLRGPVARTVVLTRIGRSPVAFVCEAVDPR